MIPVERLRKEVEIPEGVQIEIAKTIKVKGPKGEVERILSYPTVELVKKDNVVALEPKRLTKREKKIINTYVAHLKNMFKGVQEPFKYEVKVCSGHFPMSVSVVGNELVIKNFYGEKVPRRAKIVEGVTVKIEGDMVNIEGCDIERVGQTAANMEKATRITNRDRRIFQDGLWIINKGK